MASLQERLKQLQREVASLTLNDFIRLQQNSWRQLQELKSYCLETSEELNNTKAAMEEISELRLLEVVLIICIIIAPTT